MQQRISQPFPLHTTAGKTMDLTQGKTSRIAGVHHRQSLHHAQGAHHGPPWRNTSFPKQKALRRECFLSLASEKEPGENRGFS